ncbi:GNAT family N-acetyltransferase [Kitasatospora sp. NPDC057015]|uniref:GNAT family N-acetyltransferase n=1 Tax=Kitasatospora sp. NPDC057015 TaxID=3346001 RepID=UPI00363B7866
MTQAVREGVRRATEADADTLFRLSEPFARSGALRRRTIADYRSAVGAFLVAPGVLGPDGCVALRPLPAEPAHPAAGVLYNLCVRAGRQGAGLGRRLVEGVLAEAAGQGLREVFTATTGDGRLFVRYGFREVPPALAPTGWAAALDPARASTVYRLALPAA